MKLCRPILVPCSLTIETDVRRKDPDLRGVLTLLRRQDEGRFREIRLPRDRLHLRGRQPIGLQHHCQRVAGERALGKDFNPSKAVTAFVLSHEVLASSLTRRAPSHNPDLFD